MSSEPDKRVLQKFIQEFRDRGGGLHDLAWLINAGVTHARLTNRQARRLRSSFYRHILVLWLVDLIIATVVDHFLPQGLPAWAWLIEILTMCVATVLAYLMLGLVRQEDGLQLYKNFPVPNTLTLFRLFLTPMVAAVIADPTSEGKNAWLVFTLLATAAISDTLDGNIARIFHLRSDFGRAWDPAVDVIFHSVIAIALFVRNIVPWWFMLIVLLRYLLPMLVGPFVYLFRASFKVKSTWPGKLSTLMLSCFMGMFFIAVLFHWQGLRSFTLNWFLWLVVGVDAFALIYFVFRGTVVIRSKGEEAG